MRGAQTAIQIPIQPKCDHLPLFFREEVEFEEARWLPEATRVGGLRHHLNLGFLLNPVLFLPGSSKLTLRHHPPRKGTASFTFFPVFSDPPKIQRKETTARKDTGCVYTTTTVHKLLQLLEDPTFSSAAVLV